MKKTTKVIISLTILSILSFILLLYYGITHVHIGYGLKKRSNENASNVNTFWSFTFRAFEFTISPDDFKEYAAEKGWVLYDIKKWVHEHEEWWYCVRDEEGIAFNMTVVCFDDIKDTGILDKKNPRSVKKKDLYKKLSHDVRKDIKIRNGLCCVDRDSDVMMAYDYDTERFYFYGWR